MNFLAHALLAGPEETDRIFCTGWDFEVVDLDGKRIDKVIARKSPAALA